jgi:hypothetical protein
MFRETAKSRGWVHLESPVTSYYARKPAKPSKEANLSQRDLLNNTSSEGMASLPTGFGMSTVHSKRPDIASNFLTQNSFWKPPVKEKKVQNTYLRQKLSKSKDHIEKDKLKDLWQEEEDLDLKNLRTIDQWTKQLKKKSKQS